MEGELLPMKTSKVLFLFLGALVTQFFSWPAVGGYAIAGGRRNFPRPALSALDR